MKTYYDCVLTHIETGIRIRLSAVAADSLDDLKALHGKALSDSGLVDVINRGLKDGSWSLKYNRTF